MYILSTIYVALDLRRVADSYTIDPKLPWIMTYVSDHVGTLDYIISSTYIANVRQNCLLSFVCNLVIMVLLKEVGDGFL